MELSFQCHVHLFQDRLRRLSRSSTWRRSTKFLVSDSRFTIHDMNYFLEIPTTLISDDDRYPDQDSRYIYEHLKYFLSRPSPFPLPAIGVDFIDGKLVATRGRIYLRIARALARPWVRASISSTLAATDLLQSLPQGIRIVPRERLKDEEEMKVVQEYHVFFFARPLAPEIQQRFITEIAGFFERLKSPLIEPGTRKVLRVEFPFDGHCAEFEALIPVGDLTWLEDYRKLCQSFSRDVQRIVSFQGARFIEQH